MLKKIYESKEILHQYYEEKTNEYKNNLKQYNQEKLIGIVNAIKPKEDELLKFIPSPTNIAYVILDKLCDILEPLYKLTTLDKYLEKAVKRKRLIMPNEVQEYLQYDIHYSTSETI